MKVLLSETGYIISYALEGELLGAQEITLPDDLPHFEQHFTAYRVRDGTAVFDAGQESAAQYSAAKEEYLRRRETECFSVINRGQFWYDTLSEKQTEELRNWYRSWLDGTEKLAVPEKPAWLK